MGRVGEIKGVGSKWEMLPNYKRTAPATIFSPTVTDKQTYEQLGYNCTAFEFREQTDMEPLTNRDNKSVMQPPQNVVPAIHNSSWVTMIRWEWTGRKKELEHEMELDHSNIGQKRQGFQMLRRKKMD